MSAEAPSRAGERPEQQQPVQQPVVQPKVHPRPEHQEEPTENPRAGKVLRGDTENPPLITTPAGWSGDRGAGGRADAKETTFRAPDEKPSGKNTNTAEQPDSKHRAGSGADDQPKQRPEPEPRIDPTDYTEPPRAYSRQEPVVIKVRHRMPLGKYAKFLAEDVWGEAWKEHARLNPERADDIRAQQARHEKEARELEEMRQATEAAKAAAAERAETEQAAAAEAERAKNDEPSEAAEAPATDTEATVTPDTTVSVSTAGFAADAMPVGQTTAQEIPASVEADDTSYTGDVIQQGPSGEWQVIKVAGIAPGTAERVAAEVEGHLRAAAEWAEANRTSTTTAAADALGSTAVGHGATGVVIDNAAAAHAGMPNALPDIGSVAGLTGQGEGGPSFHEGGDSAEGGEPGVAGDVVSPGDSSLGSTGEAGLAYGHGGPDHRAVDSATATVQAATIAASQQHQTQQAAAAQQSQSATPVQQTGNADPLSPTVGIDQSVGLVGNTDPEGQGQATPDTGSIHEQPAALASDSKGGSAQTRQRRERQRERARLGVVRATPRLPLGDTIMTLPEVTQGKVVRGVFMGALALVGVLVAPIDEAINRTEVSNPQREGRTTWRVNVSKPGRPSRTVRVHVIPKPGQSAAQLAQQAVERRKRMLFRNTLATR